MSMDPMISASVLESTTLVIHVNNQTYNSEQNLESLIIQLLIIIIGLVGLAGNAVVLWFLGFQMQRNAFSTYILNLAGADFLYLLGRMINSLDWIIYRYNQISLYFPDSFWALLTSTYIASVSILSAISTERCLSVLFPIWYRCHRQNHMSALICALLWALSILLAILRQKYCWFYFWCKEFELPIAAWLIFSFLCLSVSNLILLVRLVFVFRKKQLTRMCVTIGLTVLIFLLCGMPWGIYYYFIFWIEVTYENIPSEIYQTAILLVCVNSCANPIIYFLVGSFRQQRQRRRQNLKLVLRRALEDVPS